jgi:CDP-diacylglycerol--glycerol-3-phosphate 3-phosphatidyltransferase
MRWTLPNILTVARLVAAPLVPIMFLYFARPWADWYAMILFIVASITDYLDGYLARAWKLESLFGAAMDPIADKAMVLIALLVINGYAGVTPWILLPSALIIYREVFVSGLRETLGDKARALKVTNLAKWKTTVQMVAIAVLFSTGIFQHSFYARIEGMDPALVMEIMEGRVPDEVGLIYYSTAGEWSAWIGIALLWFAGVLTVITGWDYFRKAMPFLKEENADA